MYRFNEIAKAWTSDSAPTLVANRRWIRVSKAPMTNTLSAATLDKPESP